MVTCTATATSAPVGGFDEMLKALKDRMDNRDLFIPRDQLIKEKNWFIDAWINNLVYQGDLSPTLADSTKTFFKERVTLNG